MKSTLAFPALSLLAAGTAHPTTRQDRILPRQWTWSITGLNGPGCPDFGADGTTAGFHTRTTYGQNTLDGSEIYHWFIAYPSLRVELGKNETSWCEAEVSYEEFEEYGSGTPSSDYRLRLHKKDTRFISTFKLNEGTTATVKFQYVDAGVTDTLTFSGPAESGQYQKEQGLTSATPAGPVKVATCGATKLKFRIDLSIAGTAAEDFVASENIQGNSYGIQLGWSYDWEKCQ